MRGRMKTLILTTILAGAATAAASAGEADVIDVGVRKTRDGLYHFGVTLRHADAGWRHYADRWEVVGPDGRVLATRKLLHPHDHEQPFTRYLNGVAIPPDIHRVTVRAHDSVHEYGGATMTVDLPR